MRQTGYYAGLPLNIWIYVRGCRILLQCYNICVQLAHSIMDFLCNPECNTLWVLVLQPCSPLHHTCAGKKNTTRRWVGAELSHTATIKCVTVQQGFRNRMYEYANDPNLQWEAVPL